MYSSGGSEELSAWNFMDTSWTLQYMCEWISFSGLLKDLIGGPYI